MPPGEVNVFGRRALKRGCGVDAPLPRTARKTCKYTCKIHVRGELHGRVARTRGGETLRELSHPPSLSLSLSLFHAARGGNFNIRGGEDFAKHFPRKICAAGGEGNLEV